MRELLDGVDLANTIRLLIASGTSRILAVEGESDYDVLFESFTGTRLELMPGFGKESLLEAAALLLSDMSDSVRFLVDADFDRLLNTGVLNPANVVASDYYDIFIDAVKAAPELLARIARLNCASRASAETLEPHLSLSWILAAEVGAVRYASACESWNLDTSRFPIHLFVPDSPDGVVDSASIIKMALQRTTGCTVQLESVISALSSQIAALPDRSVLANSHDLLNALCHVNRKFAGGTASTGYESQLILVAAGLMHRVPVVAELQRWASAA